MSKQANHFAIGLFVLSAFIIAVGIFVVFGSGTLYKRTAILVATFRESTNGLRVGAKVKAYGVEIGQVKKIKLHRVQRTDEVVIPVLMEIDLDHVANLLGFRSYDTFMEEAGMDHLKRDVLAQLQLESFVTGLLYVELVFGRQEQGYILHDERFAEYRSVPTAPTDMQVLLKSIQSIAQNIGRIDFAGLMEETSGTLKDIRGSINDLELKEVVSNMNSLVIDTRSKVNSPELESAAREMRRLLDTLNRFAGILDGRAEGTLEQFDKTMIELETASKRAQTWLDPSYALYREVVDALDKIGDASRSLRVLVEYLERNPNALITGRRQQEEESKQ